MIVIREALDYLTPWAWPDIKAFTGNSVVRKNGALVMGRGVARILRDNYPGLDKQLGTAVSTRRLDARLASVNMGGSQVLIWYQVKHHWAGDASPCLIEEAANQLGLLARNNPSFRFHINAPGIGNGRLTWEQVEPLIRHMPDNVFVYRI